MPHVDDNAAPDLVLLKSVEDEMARVSATLGELNRDDVDPASLVAWVPDAEDTDATADEMVPVVS
ncbi:MAG: hypothetical protein GXP35_10860 [Actinobacteria bacterium]|nr:hypothetical protein [Actinomycetota bacterium]